MIKIISHGAKCHFFCSFRLGCFSDTKKETPIHVWAELEMLYNLAITLVVWLMVDENKNPIYDYWYRGDVVSDITCLNFNT